MQPALDPVGLVVLDCLLAGVVEEILFAIADVLAIVFCVALSGIERVS